MQSPLILALDIGTSSTRAMLFDATAQPVPNCVAQIPYQPQTTGDGGVTFDAKELFNHVIAAIDQLLHLAGPLAAQIGGVTSDTFVSNVLGVAANGEPVTPVYTYADTRNAPDAEALRTELGATGIAAVHDRTGCLIHTSYLPARFRWLARTQPDLLKQVTDWLSVGEYIYWQLFGQRAASYSVASWTGLLNRRDLTWDETWLRALPVRAEQLSPLVNSDQPFIGLQTQWAERWPALKNVPWFPAIGDGAAANLGSGCDNPRRVALTMGTTGAMRVVLDPSLPTLPSGLWLYRVDRNRGLLGGATTEGGNLFAWLRETLQLPPTKQVENELVNRPPAAHGLTVLPFIAGERAPGWNDKAKASLVGFTLNTKPIDIVQAALEGIAYRFAIIFERLHTYLATGGEFQIIANGAGLLSSPAWLQIFADVLGQPILTLTEKETTSRGIALLGLEQLGVIQHTSAIAPTTGLTYIPNAERHAIHRGALERQKYFYGQLHS